MIITVSLYVSLTTLKATAASEVKHHIMHLGLVHEPEILDCDNPICKYTHIVISVCHKNRSLSLFLPRAEYVPVRNVELNVVLN
jgi:hypothetical protein